MEKNTRLELAFNFVQYTDRNIFLTGKAGTGKTTFLHQLRATTPKRMAVVAPTGVAAINAGGVTINSFFQLPFGPYVPGGDNQAGRHKRFSKDKINLIRSLDLLVIDEISMVRADTLDHIDEVLRRFRNHSRPFGGVQLLMIGDLHQLSPVIKDEDWQILKDFYTNLYFFNSRALQSALPVSIELKHIYRQEDSGFIDLLNSVRQNQLNKDVLDKLNQRYIPDFNPTDEEGYITLTTHNKYALEINENKLAQINDKSRTFHAIIRDDFPEYSYPTVAELELKKGAQVMFVKNDPSQEKLYYNGKIGIITAMSDELISVKCPGDFHEISVSPVEWTNIRYDLDPQTKEISEKTIGTFSQYPLKLAWAITIHKSQGLTFERAIIDANLAFAHGQVYVALSRCKTFEGLVLRSPISIGSVKTDGTVAEYTRNITGNTPGEQELNSAKSAFQQELLYELFAFTTMKSLLFKLKKTFEDHHTILDPQINENLTAIRTSAEKEIFHVAETFGRQLKAILEHTPLPEENAELQNRIKKAGVYFDEKISSIVHGGLSALNTDTDNKIVRTAIKSILDDLFKEIAIKCALMKLCNNGFSTIDYLRTRADAEIDLSSRQSEQNPEKVVKNIIHPELYQALRSWRDELAAERQVPLYHILAQKTLLELVHTLPSNSQELEQIKGIGKMKIRQFGIEILEIINSYCERHGIERQPAGQQIVEKPEKVNTRQVSFNLFKEGKTIAEIAAVRSLTTSTIEGHLASFINSGEISVFDLVTKIKVARIMAYIVQNPGSPTVEIKAALGESITYSELKAVMNHIQYISQQEA